MKDMKGNEGHEEELFWKLFLKELLSRNFFEKVFLHALHVLHELHVCFW